ncbi:MAG TPA: vitamin K epoxide reductase family protein [Anaerolineales bacterium]|nr:vitamin K epoxide reductase family protein [Anaerolineales bacterium]
MMIRNNFLLILVLFMVIFAFPVQAQSKTPVVNAVLFYSPTCPHCHQVMNVDLPPLMEKYGGQLVILAVNVTVQEGSDLYRLAVAAFSIPQERIGVPTLIVGNTVLVGSGEIPSFFPAIIEKGLQTDGIPWPPLPGLTPFLEAQGLLQPEPVELTMGERFALDPVGNSLAVAVLVGMLLSVFLAGYALLKGIHLSPWPDWVLPMLVVIGLAIAGYLTYVETANTKAVCGPVGDCNTVQESEYARLFGVLPIGLLGMVGYVGIGIAWMLKTYSANEPATIGALAIWGLALFGTFFSIYLTFLEPFVIGATCAWCLSSAIIMTLLLWASTPSAKQAWEQSHMTMKTGQA